MIDKKQASAAVKAVEAVLRRWDPIGVGAESPSEYSSYAPHLVSIVAKGGSVLELAAHLGQLRTKTMGLPDNSEADQKAAAEIARAVQV